MRPTIIVTQEPIEMTLTFKAYQDFTDTTRIYKHKIIYPTLGLAGEAGEVAEKVKKMLRDEDGELSEDRRDAILAEVSDVLWYIAALCDDLGSSIEEVAKLNIDKLTKRKAAGRLSGDGDNR